MAVTTMPSTDARAAVASRAVSRARAIKRFKLTLLLPMAGMGARRLQDIGRNGNLVWLAVVPAALAQLFRIFFFGPFGIFGALAYMFTIGPILGLIGFIAAVVLIYFWCQPGNAGPNAYGAPPDGSVPATSS